MSLKVENIKIFSVGLDHPECVALSDDGSVWAGGEAGQIYRIPPEGGEPEIIANTNGFILGISFSPSFEWLLICDLGNKCLWRLEIKSRKIEKFSCGMSGLKFKNPNYAVFDGKGRIFVSDSGDFKKNNGIIYCFKEDGGGYIWHEGPFDFANGLAISPDKKYLHVVCSWLPGTERIEIKEDGSSGAREVYTTLPNICPDGIAFGPNGNLCISCYAPNIILEVDKNTRNVKTIIEDWEGHILSNPTNIMFDYQNDFIYVANLGRWHISRIKIRSLKYFNSTNH